MPTQEDISQDDPSIAAQNAVVAEQSVQEDVQAGKTQDAYCDGPPLARSRSAGHQPSLGYSMSYRRPSHIAAGCSRPAHLMGLSAPGPTYLTADDEEAVRDDERSLLRDNQFLPPKHPRTSSATSARSKTRSFVDSWCRRGRGDDEALDEPDTNEAADETTRLIPSGDSTLPSGGPDSPEQLDKAWTQAVEAGQVQTTWQRETKVLGRYSRSLILTFFLQYSLTVCSVFAVGHIGTVELGAVSLGSMTTNITGYAVLQGLATSLDTLCAQAYGSGNKTLVGVQTQRMIVFLWIVLIPIGTIWLAGGSILSRIVPDPRTADMAGLYLKVALIGTPAYAAFESMKRYCQAQGLFTANLYVLLIVAPLNAFLHWLFVWHLEMGFVGAPLSVTITETLMPFLLGLYIYLIAGRECWGGLTSAAFKNWWPMVRLALPGLVMVVAEYLAFEILTFGASWISTTHLAAQSVLSTVLILLYNIPFPISIAASTRVANLIGAGLPDAARTAAKVALVVASFAGLLNMLLLSTLRYHVPRLFTDDEAVIEIVAKLLPLCAAFQLWDAIAAQCNGILRGIGRQEVGGYVSLAAYYGVAMPISFGTGFGLEWGLVGLWLGPAIALLLVAGVEGWFIWRVSWERAVEEARRRVDAG